MKLHPYIRKTPARSRESGYFLIVMMLFLTVLAITLTTVAPSMVQQIRREREIELIHRGKAYARAIRLFYRKFGRYPVRLEELENTNNIRFLRKRFKDPMTADGSWRLIHFGEAQIANPAAPVLPGATVPGAATTGSLSSASASPFANTFGTTAGTAQTGAVQATTGQGILGNPAGGPTSESGQTGTSSSSGGDSSQPTASKPGATQPGSPTGPTLGGGAIVGVASTSKKTSIKELNKKNHYNEWEFVYDPRLEILVPQIAGAANPTAPGVQQPATQPGFGSPGMNPTPQQPVGQGR